MRLHQRIMYLSTEWEILEMYDTGVLLKSLNKNISDRFVSSSDARYFKTNSH